MLELKLFLVTGLFPETLPHQSCSKTQTQTEREAKPSIHSEWPAMASLHLLPTTRPLLSQPSFHKFSPTSSQSCRPPLQFDSLPLVSKLSATHVKVSTSIRAVTSVSEETEKKEESVKKPTSYRPVVILPVRDSWILSF